MSQGDEATGSEVTKRPPGNPNWGPGRTANPGGRPKGLAAEIRRTSTPERLKGLFEEVAYDPTASKRDRMEAGRWLSDHGYGKAPETHIVGAMPEELREATAELTREQLLGLIEAGTGLDGAPMLAASSAAVVVQVPEDAELIE